MQTSILFPSNSRNRKWRFPLESETIGSTGTPRSASHWLAFSSFFAKKITCRLFTAAPIPPAKGIRPYWKCAGPQKVVGSRLLDRFSSRANRAFACTILARLSDFARLSHNRPGWKTAAYPTSMRPRFLLPVHLVRRATDILAQWVRRDLHQLNSAVPPSWESVRNDCGQ
jgi:hypothetical protein